MVKFDHMEVVTAITLVLPVEQVDESVLVSRQPPCTDWVIDWPLENHYSFVVPDLD